MSYRHITGANFSQPLLTADEELTLVKQWQQHQDPHAREKILSRHMRLVISIAYKLSGYGIDKEDLISEGIIGMMRALDKFEISRATRFATYSLWYIRAAMQQYILNNWSSVKIGTTANQRKLFFNLRRIKNEMLLFAKNGLAEDDGKAIAEQLEVPLPEVIQMEQRLSHGDFSLDTPINQANNNITWVDTLADAGPNPFQATEKKLRNQRYQQQLQQALGCLDWRELLIVRKRYLCEKSQTLMQLAQQLGISHERTRQLEQRAINKLSKSIVAMNNLPKPGNKLTQSSYASNAA